MAETKTPLQEAQDQYRAAYTVFNDALRESQEEMDAMRERHRVRLLELRQKMLQAQANVESVARKKP